jgi:hypothetical protein
MLASTSPIDVRERLEEYRRAVRPVRLRPRTLEGLVIPRCMYGIAQISPSDKRRIIDTGPSPTSVGPPMKEQSTSDTRQLALIDCFARATWVALIVALLCLAVDAYSIFWMPHHSAADRGPYHAATLFSVTLWILQIVVGILALWLFRFAFLRPPRFLSKQ